MLDGGHEEHQVHLLGVIHTVVVLETVLCSALHFIAIVELAVNVLVGLLAGVTAGVAQWHEGSEEERLHLDDAVPVLLEFILNDGVDHGLEDVSVALGDHTILEHTQALVRPQLDHVVFVGDSLGIRLGDALEDLADISQVVSVMRLGRSRLELAHGLHVDEDGLGNQRVLQALHRLREGRLALRSEQPIHDVRENELQTVIRVGFDVQDVEMANVPLRDRVAAVSRRTHSGSKPHISQLSEFPLRGVDIVPSGIVHPLSEQLDRRLGSELLLLRHVEVINEDNSLLAVLRTVDTLSLLLHLAIDDAFCLVGRGLGREAERVVGPLLVVEVFLEHGVNSDRLSSTGGTHEQDVLGVEEKSLDHVVHTNRVDGRDVQLQVGELLVDLVLVNGVHPVDPLHLGLVEIQVKQRLVVTSDLVRHLHGLVLHVTHVDLVLCYDIFTVEHLLKHLGEARASELVHGATNTPD
mmetsp:Transcript_20678/g.31621  ORF Transcript_20678/g.31621 Transcript_20678/m.31621 type:complete len:466 (-) Transcript_20678:2095-3492(-)